MPQMSPKLAAALDHEYGPVAASFTINQIPEGGAPQKIREQWIGVPLPVRQAHIEFGSMNTASYIDFLTRTEKINRFPVRILGMEAIDALIDAEKPEAADFWRPHEFGIFIFRGYEGELKTLE